MIVVLGASAAGSAASIVPPFCVNAPVTDGVTILPPSWVSATDAVPLSISPAVTVPEATIAADFTVIVPPLASVSPANVMAFAPASSVMLPPSPGVVPPAVVSRPATSSPAAVGAVTRFTSAALPPILSMALTAFASPSFAAPVRSRATSSAVSFVESAFSSFTSLPVRSNFWAEVAFLNVMSFATWLAGSSSVSSNAFTFATPSTSSASRSTSVFVTTSTDAALPVTFAISLAAPPSVTAFASSSSSGVTSLPSDCTTSLASTERPTANVLFPLNVTLRCSSGS